MVLALTRSYDKAVVELRHVVQSSPGLAQAHVDLADVLMAMGRVDEAAREYTIAANGNDAAAREAAQAGLRALEPLKPQSNGQVTGNLSSSSFKSTRRFDCAPRGDEGEMASASE